MFKRILAISAYAVATMSLLCLGAGVTGQSASAATVTYQVSLKSAQGDMGTRKMTIKGEFFAWDANSPGLPLKFIKNKDGEFLIRPNKKVIGKYPAGTNRQSPYTFLPGPNGDVKSFVADQKAKAAGTEKIKGKSYKIYTYTEEQSGWKCKLWLDAKTTQPYKLILTGAKKTDQITAVYSSFKVGVPVSDSLFELPKGYAVRSMPVQVAKPPVK